MKAQLYVCPACGQMRLRSILSATEMATRRWPECGGEQLERYAGGQTHEWTRLSLVGEVELRMLEPA